MQIEVFLPSMLADCLHGARSLRIPAQTLADAVQNLRAANPLLRAHLFTESGDLRPNVLIFLNNENIRWIENWQLPLHPTDQIHIVPAVSGGSPIPRRAAFSPPPSPIQ